MTTIPLLPSLRRTGRRAMCHRHTSAPLQSEFGTSCTRQVYVGWGVIMTTYKTQDKRVFPSLSYEHVGHEARFSQPRGGPE